MASKPETTYYQSIHRLLPASLHREKMFNPYSSGTPDVWYSGTKADLWVEYKYLRVVPKKAQIVVRKMLTPLQLLWLRERHLEGRNVVVILGTPIASWVYGELSWDWPNGILPADFEKHGWSRQRVADYILTRTMNATHQSAGRGGASNKPDVQDPVHIDPDRPADQGKT